jgi:hypothetical protein
MWPNTRFTPLALSAALACSSSPPGGHEGTGDAAQSSDARTAASDANSCAELSWDSEELFTDIYGGAGFALDFAVDSSGNPHATLGEVTLSYATKKTGEWQIEELTDSGPCFVGRTSALALDSAQRPHIVYNGSDGFDCDVMNYARWDGQPGNTHP